MTTVTATAEKGRYFIKCEGHAEGKDPAICTAISTLCCSLELFCANVDGIKFEVLKEPGQFAIRFGGNPACRAAFDFTIWALMALQHDHVGYLKIDKIKDKDPFYDSYGRRPKK